MTENIYGIGKRKEAIAKVTLKDGEGKIRINERIATLYFQNNLTYLENIKSPLDIAGINNNYDIFIKANGGGLMAQSDAIKLAISRAILKIDLKNRKPLKTKNLLTRDSRRVERKKYGLKKARKASQFSKR